MKPTWEVKWIDNDSDLLGVVEIIKNRPILSIDTETAGWQTNNEKLCLIQIGDPAEEKIYLIDALAINNLQVLKPVIEEPIPALIAHNANFEERQFARHEMRMRGSIDTLKMAKTLRPDLPSRTLKSCCNFILNLDISKEEQTSDWSLRPLTKSQIEYAALDAEVTWKLYEILHEMEAKLVVNTSLAVSDLMRELYETERRNFELTRKIAAEIQLNKQKAEGLKSVIRSKLINGESPYKGEFGECSIQRVKRTEINPEKLRTLMPEIADAAIVESVPRDRLKDLMNEHSIDPKMLEQITEIIRYDDRLNLELGDF
jgi:hypothetical protein